MAATNTILLDVYEIDGIPTTYFKELFPSDLQAGPYFGGNPNLYSIAVGFDKRRYSVVQTVTAIQTLTNS